MTEVLVYATLIRYLYEGGAHLNQLTSLYDIGLLGVHTSLGFWTGTPRRS